MLPGANVSAALVRPRRFGAALVMGVRASRMALRHYDLATRAAYAIEARLAQRADAVIANSQAGRDAAEARGFPAARIHVVANGIDAARFRPDAAERATWRQRLTIAPGAPVIGMVARFDPMKAHDVFLEAAARLHATRPDVRFILAGAGVHSSNPTIVDAIGRLGLGRSVTLVGEQAHVESLYPSFDIATLSSRFGEGFPNVLAEAMASELPCVATDVGDSRALIGATGRIVPPGDADALAAAWLELLQLDTGARTALGRAAREFVMARHGVARLAEETEAVLRKAVA
jgi:glycosyltransferase involved in cell wall biosynthesis